MIASRSWPVGQAVAAQKPDRAIILRVWCRVVVRICITLTLLVSFAIGAAVVRTAAPIVAACTLCVVLTSMVSGIGARIRPAVVHAAAAAAIAVVIAFGMMMLRLQRWVSRGTP